MAESWETWRFRWMMNLAPVYRGTGGKMRYIRSDWREMRAELPLSLRTRNYVGTIYGGSLYGFVDPLYMLMLIHILGRDYVVWDKSAAIRFLKPGRSRLYARIVIDEDETAEIKRLLEAEHSITRNYTISIEDIDGIVHAEVDKEIYFRKKPTGTS